MNRFKVVISNPGYGAHIRQSVLAYKEAEMLDYFCTSFLLPSNIITKTIESKFKGLKSKQFNGINANQVRKFQFPEIIRLVASKYLSTNATDKIWEWSELYFDNWVSKNLNSTIDIFHGYEHACLFSLEKCRKEKIFSVYEQPSAHHLYVNENVIKPLQNTEDFFRTNYKNLYNSELSNKRNIRRDAELNLANLIICNSHYVKKTLMHAGVLEEKIAVLPLGFPDVKERTIYSKSKLRFMLSGNLSYLKGTHHVLRVWKNNPELFKNHELICIGSNSLSEEEWSDLPNNVVRMNRLNSEEYLKELENADVYILNTYSDGFGMVMSEAMAYGIAVIGTENSAAPDIIENNNNGKIISVGDEASLLEAMKWMILNPEELAEMRIAAMNYAKQHSWSNFRKELPKLISNTFNKFKRDA